MGTWWRTKSWHRPALGSSSNLTQGLNPRAISLKRHWGPLNGVWVSGVGTWKKLNLFWPKITNSRCNWIINKLNKCTLTAEISYLGLRISTESVSTVRSTFSLISSGILMETVSHSQDADPGVLKLICKSNTLLFHKWSNFFYTIYRLILST